MSSSSLNAAQATDVPERFDPETMRGEIIQAEHLARYRWVSGLVAGQRVLDAGCGTAYGSALLAEAGAAEVIGVDCACEILEAARPEMPTIVTLEAGDVTSLQFEDGRFDLVVCFEVIEHLENPGRALDEFRRVLGPAGTLAISSPNRDVYPPGNPHHLHEYTPEELKAELLERFDSVRLERQHTWITSGVLDDTSFCAGGDSDLGESFRIRKLESEEPGSELYTVALAGLSELPTGVPTFELATAVELRRWDALWHEQQTMLEEQAKLLARHERDMQGSEISQLRVQLEGAERELARLPELETQVRDLVELNEELMERLDVVDLDLLRATADRYTVLVQSSSWRMTRPLRQITAIIRNLTR
ncbi:MAG: methyltransferase domain-containing protein [Solirubrobacterales bacterium]